MSTTPQINQLRATANRLRSLSAVISTGRAMTVHRLAGNDTWIGPTQQFCHDSLLGVRRLLESTTETLDDTVQRLDRQADELVLHPPALKVMLS
jgi:hypothetical protein